jgi:hypothetical protein
MISNKKHTLKKRQLELMREKELVMNEFVNYVNALPHKNGETSLST